MEKMQFEIATDICFCITLVLHSFPIDYSLWAPRSSIFLPSIVHITLFHLNEKSSPYLEIMQMAQSVCDSEISLYP